MADVDLPTPSSLKSAVSAFPAIPSQHFLCKAATALRHDFILSGQVARAQPLRAQNVHHRGILSFFLFSFFTVFAISHTVQRTA